MRELAGDAALGELEDHLLGLVDEVLGVTRPLPAEPRDLLSGPDQAAQRRHLADDPRVVRGVRGGRDERGELVDPDATARVLELAALLQRVDERDRVDGLAARVQGEGGAIDLRVALAIEVARVDDLADGPDRPGGEHHRAEDGLLGVEILGWDRGRLRRLGNLGDHASIRPVAVGLAQPRCPLLLGEKRPICRGKNACSPVLSTAERTLSPQNGASGRSNFPLPAPFSRINPQALEKPVDES